MLALSTLKVPVSVTLEVSATTASTAAVLAVAVVVGVN